MTDTVARAKQPVSAHRLHELNRYIEQRTGGGGGPRPALRSAQAFHDSWARICAHEEVTQAVQRGPENAGPLNSHMLVLRTLQILGELSPDYLHHFMVQADTLLWLDNASGQLKPAAAAKTSRRARTKP